MKQTVACALLASTITATPICAKSPLIQREVRSDRTAAAAELNNPVDILSVTNAFNKWTDAVIAKNRKVIESFHDTDFRAGMGTRMFTKDQHVELEVIVPNAEMRLLGIQLTRRVGDLLLVWSTHFIRVTSLPQIPDLGLTGDWGGEAMAKKGFVQNEFSVWRDAKGRLKCLSFVSSRAR